MGRRMDLEGLTGLALARIGAAVVVEFREM